MRKIFRFLNLVEEETTPTEDTKLAKITPGLSPDFHDLY